MKKSAGILAYRQREAIEFFLVHPGGPFYRNKDEGIWSVPKGEFLDDEDPLEAAKRECFEETGYQLQGDFISLKPIKQKSGKIVTAWGIKQEIDEANIKSNVFSVEWPPRSGKFREFPEIDKAGWFLLEEARRKILPAQQPLIDELFEILAGRQ